MKSTRRPAWIWVSAALLAVFPFVASASAAVTSLASPGEPHPAPADPSEPKTSEGSEDVDEAEPLNFCGPWIGEPCGSSGRCWKSCRTCHNPANGNDWVECGPCYNSTGHGPC